MISMRRILEVFILFLCGTIIILSFITSQKDIERYGEAEITVPEFRIDMKYGIILDSLIIIKDRIKRNEILGDILSRYNVDLSKIDELVKVSKTVFNVRRIKRGNPYSLICSKDSVKQVLYFVYEETTTSYVVFDLNDSVGVYRGKMEIEIEEASASGVIKSSLWEAMIENKIDPNLANELSEIYAWVIDFFDIKKGDYYKVIYEEHYVDGEYIGLGKILAALFNHRGEEYYAFYFVQDSIGDYYDRDAGSLRRTFLKAPLRFRRISSGFSYNRFHPILKIYRPHTGVDYAASYGTPVHSVGDGSVTKAYWSKQGGRTVKIKHNGTYTTCYMHLSAYGKGIKNGVRVKQGDIIGYVGRSGLATGPHLDFRFYRNGKPVNPLRLEFPPLRPVDSVHMERFYNIRNDMMEKLSKAEINK